ncbi:serine hydrolase domain-containing protein [Kiloniella sp. b19]|uniref:serine hydrolase domain-containing protein n=1 Tax=Kiloniella sp. GXU_MW_B19 TaxID=3141326 RepID=UPI0031D24728
MMTVQAGAGGTALEERLRSAFDQGELPGLHAVLVEHRGERIAELYFEGQDWSWAEDLGVRQFGPEELHDLRSVTKSIAGLLYGIALEEGKVPPLSAPIYRHLPDYADVFSKDARKKTITVADLLTMKMGIEWNEAGGYVDRSNDEVGMEFANDRYRYVLEKDMLEAPGEVWRYNGGAVALIGKLIEDGTGRTLEAYAQERLFEPLAIRDFGWLKGGDSVDSPASGLRLTAPGLARIGRMILDGGQYKGQRIVSEAWLAESFAPRADAFDGIRYGYLWWLDGMSEKPRWAAAFGNGGQRLSIDPANELVVVIFAGNYNAPEDWKIPVRVVLDFVLPAISD